MTRSSEPSELRELCRGITRSFVHLETRDAYGTEVELPHLAKWRRGEPDNYEWLGWWLEMLREHRQAGKACRRLRIVSEPVSEYQRWILSHIDLFLEAGEDIRYLPRQRLTTTSLPASGDFYVFDDETVVFLHYAGTGTNASYEITEDPQTVRACAEAFQSVWELTVPFHDYRPE